MPINKKRDAAEEFKKRWTGIGQEDKHDQKFWNDILQNIFGITDPNYIDYQKRVTIDGNTKRIDGYIPKTKVLIEQKSIDKSLTKPLPHGDKKLTAFEQAKEYADALPHDEHPRWIVTSNFQEFKVYDLNHPGNPPETILLEKFEKDYSRLGFIKDENDTRIKEEEELSIKAGELVGEIYNAFKKQYQDPESDETLHSLNILCVRIVFLLYAEDAGILGENNMFYKYLNKFKTENVRTAIVKLFQILNQPEEERDKYEDEYLLQFPYINGGLFADDNIEIPPFTNEIVDAIMNKASMGFDWSEISPTIFGAVFESTLNPVTRREGGMHYTSIENIHKVIDPLFLNELKDELEDIKLIGERRKRDRKLADFQNKLADIKFLDPACGSGNFLTETYISLRKMENEILELIGTGQLEFVFSSKDNPIKVSINQFYGIEINDFAVDVARAALWIAEAQMMQKTEHIIKHNLDLFPLKNNKNIVEGNALRMDWNDVVSNTECHYIMGNPPFVGTNYLNNGQRDDLNLIFKLNKKRSKLDYVTAWFSKASFYIYNTEIESAFVSTNSIIQGEQVGILWADLLSRIQIIFAHRSFIWDSEAKNTAKVHCVIIGFVSIANQKDITKKIFENSNVKDVIKISPYLVETENVLIVSRPKPLCEIPKMCKGSQPTDAGNLLLSETEKNDLENKYPILKKYIKLCLGSKEFINNIKRYCLWLIDASLIDFKGIPEVMERFSNIKKMRQASSSPQTRDKADAPHLFTDIRQPQNNYLIVPSVSSERRRYIPIGFCDPNIIATNLVLIVPNATLYDFGVLTSNVHMAWMRQVAGRLEMRYRYSKDIVYNNFPWPGPTEEQKKKIEKTAQGILDARALFPDSSLADLYDENTMPAELRKAHKENDKAVWEAYGKEWNISSEQDCVAELFKMYEKLLEEKTKDK